MEPTLFFVFYSSLLACDFCCLFFYVGILSHLAHFRHLSVYHIEFPQKL